MTTTLDALCFDAKDPERIAEFWGAFLGWERSADPRDGIAIVPSGGTGFQLRFVACASEKTGQNAAHFDLTSTSEEGQKATVERALELGARHVDVGQLPEEGHVVLADPEGNEFCVIEPGNAFLAGTGFIGALAGDGSRAVGHFWSQALDWPLVWDENEETAIQAPYGGTKLTWGGPPLLPGTGHMRVSYDLAPPAGGDQAAEIERLLALGARRIDGGGPDASGRVVLTDPDGREFGVLRAR
ncbi:VOC family protein [Streptomyces sp. NPDC060194]|uniref:VOC family protein n=1 Tax=Streptomyces sp. NPDC060194 TaxID=3347069 RepID=UPI00365B97E6